MKVKNIAYSNSKGQFVIPVEVRRALRINEQTILNIKQVGEGIYIQPSEIRPIVPTNDTTFLKMLSDNRGFMAGDPNFTDESLVKRRKIEIARQKKLKKIW